jgi:hypothetical protein
MSSSSPPERVDIKVAELNGLLARIESVLPKNDFELIRSLVETLVVLTRIIRESGSTIARLRRMMGFPSSEKMADVLSASQGQNGETGTDASEELDADRPDDQNPEANSGQQQNDGQNDPSRTREKRKGHGRLPAAAYTAATHTSVPHTSLRVGGQHPGCPGKLYRLPPAQILRIIGQSPLVAECLDLERLRCSGCGAVFTADCPPDARGNKYTESAVSMMALLRYDGGMPLNRLQRIQLALGTPLPASTQWDVVSKTVRFMVPVYKELSLAAAAGSLVHNDDTHIRVLDLMGKRRDKLLSAGQLADPDRTGLFTTAIVSQTEHGPIALFFTGRNHAGENLAQLLDSRATELSPPILMCDALARNIPKGHEVIESNCLCHGRRHVLDEVSGFPQESRHILESLAKVFHNEKTCRTKGFTDQERLLFHQSYSQSLMADLEKWMKAQLADKRIEPNSGMGKAINYLLKRWDKLTLFLTVPGAPLENNICERALKMAIAHRKNSLFFRSLIGANVGDVYMTIIYTARLHGVNPFDYLNALQRHAANVAKRPAEWLPWNYQSTLEQLLLSNAA